MSAKKLFLISTLSLSFSFANEETVASSNEAKAAPKQIAEEVKDLKDLDIPKISQSFGHLIGKNLQSLGFDFNMELVISGIRDSLAGKESPMSESECVQAISLIQENAFQKLADANLKQANEFLEKNASNDGVVEIEKGKLQYQVLAEGKGSKVKEGDTPLIKYVGKFIDGKVFGESKEEESISLDDTIAGFSKGIVGMKEGEKRKLFIHPELGYGESGFLPPSSLLEFEIEVVKANVQNEEAEALTKMPNSSKDASEIADSSSESLESNKATR